MRAPLLSALAALLCCAPARAGRPSFEGQGVHELQWDFGDRVNLDNQLTLALDVPLWKGATLQAKTLHLASTYGTVIDDMMGYSNLSADNMLAAVAVCDLTQELHSPRATTRLALGVRNTNEDFFATDLTLFFLNAALGCVPTVGCNYPMANYPTAGMSLSVRVETERGWVFQTAFYNGRGYSGWKRHDNPFAVRFGHDGVCNFTEAAKRTERGHYCLGVCSHSHMHHVDSLPKRGGSATIYAYAEHELLRSDRLRLQLLAHFSQNTYRHNPCTRHAALGLLASLGKHDFGAVFNYAQFSEGREWQAELSYQLTFNDTVAFHPAVQWVRSCGVDAAVGQARLTVSF